MKNLKQNSLSRIIDGFILLAFLAGQILTPVIGFAADGLGTPLDVASSAAPAQVLPNLGTTLELSTVYAPPVLLGLKVHPENPLLFDFIVDRGQTKLSDEEFKVETQKLVEYFFAALTIPDKEVWVNLSPYEKDRIIPDVLGKTQMGKTMLEQDYLLKQLASSLTNPDTELGKKYWDQVNKAGTLDAGRLTLERNSTTSVQPLATNNFNKVWIVPAKAKVLESNGIVVVDEKRLKVMMAEGMQENLTPPNPLFKKEGEKGVASITPSLDKEGEGGVLKSNVSSKIFRTTILPTIEKEVNEGKDFAAVRQIYNSVILAAWYKQALKESLLGKVYTDKAKVAGIETDDKEMKQRIYQQYLAAFKKGAYNFIKEEEDADGDLIPRKYFSGGVKVAALGEVAGSALEVQMVSSAAVEQPILRASASVVRVQGEEKKASADRLNLELSTQEVTGGAVALIPADEQMSKIEELSDLKNQLQNQWTSLTTDQANEILKKAEAILSSLGNPGFIKLGNVRMGIKKEIEYKRRVIDEEIKLRDVAKIFGRPFIAAGSWLAPNLEHPNGSEDTAYWGHVTNYSSIYSIIFKGSGNFRGTSRSPIFINSGGLGQAARARLNNQPGVVPLIFRKSSFESAGLGVNTGWGEATINIDRDVSLTLLAPYSKAFVWQAVLTQIEGQGETLTNEKQGKIAMALGYADYLHLESELSPLLVELNQRIDRWSASSALSEYLFSSDDPIVRGAVKSLAEQLFKESVFISDSQITDFRLSVYFLTVLLPTIPARELIINLLSPESESNVVDKMISEALLIAANSYPAIFTENRLIPVLDSLLEYTRELKETERYPIYNDQFRGSHFLAVRFMASLLVIRDVNLGEFITLADTVNRNINTIAATHTTISRYLDSLEVQDKFIADTIREALPVSFLESAHWDEFNYILHDVRSFLAKKHMESVILRNRGSVGSSAITPKQLTASTPSATNLTEEPKKVGGINFDPTLLNLQIKRDGSGVPLPLPEQNIENINIEGLFPVIINIQPVNVQTLPVFLGKESQNSLLEV